MTDTANLGLPCIEGGQAQKHVTHNDALRILDTLVQLAVLDRDLTASPGSPAEGQSWIVNAGATGAWAGHDNAIASWQDGAWQFSAPNIGWLAYVIDESALVAWDGGAWVSAIDAVTPTALNNMTLLGVGTTADATNPVSAKLNNALFAARTMAEGGDGNLRYKLSKETEAGTASFLFQDNYSGRAEIGLVGNDDFYFKVSPDGSTWHDAIVIDKTSGEVSFPQGGASGDLELTLAELTLGVADALNTAQTVGAAGNRFADSFDVLTYVDTGAAINLDSGAAGLLKPSQFGGSNNAIDPSEFAKIGNATEGGGLVASFDGTTIQTSTACAIGSNNPNSGPWLGLDLGFGNAKKIGGCEIWGSSNIGYRAGGGAAVTVKVYGSNAEPSVAGEGSLLGYFASIDIGGNHVDQQSGFDTSSAYRYIWALVDVGTTAGTSHVAELKFYEFSPGPANNMVVTSAPLPAVSVPSTAKLVARVKEIDGILLNADLIFSASRDGGATYSAFVMTRKFTANSIAVYESDSLDISSQPTGTDVKWKVESANNKSFELHDIYLYWS